MFYVTPIAEIRREEKKSVVDQCDSALYLMKHVETGIQISQSEAVVVHLLMLHDQTHQTI